MPLTDDFSYKLGDSGVVLNPDSITPPFVDITKVSGLDNAPYRTTERDHEGTDGGFLDAEYEKGRPLVLEGMAYADGLAVESFLDSLKANFAPSRVLIPFYFKKPGVAERLLWVKPLGCRYDEETIRRVGCTNIQFSMFAEDPRIYTSTQQSVTITQSSTSISGRSYNRSYSYGYGAAVAPDQANLYVSGNRPTPALLTITGPAPVVNPQIINDTLGFTMSFDITVPAMNSLVIDTYYHTVKLEGQNRRKALLNPTWFMLQPGNNFIRFRSATSVAATLNIKYRDAWR